MRLGTRLLHLHNRRWTSTKVPWNITFRAMTSDGLGVCGSADSTVLRSSLARALFSLWPLEPHVPTLGGLAHMPGTTTVLGAGLVATKPVPEAAVWATSRLR